MIPHVASQDGAGDNFRVFDADDYLAARHPSWALLEQFGAVWAAGDQVYVARCCAEIIVTLASRWPEKYPLEVGNVLDALHAQVVSVRPRVKS